MSDRSLSMPFQNTPNSMHLFNPFLTSITWRRLSFKLRECRPCYGSLKSGLRRNIKHAKMHRIHLHNANGFLELPRKMQPFTVNRL
ncbi:hypothetical protein EMPG_15988 [Blastomyces silverae]|uniref:Uncharacterized protein n=1 Tax=Blastomyces silverae TaxID=2060906 RepID=A0A0H1BBS9_9EURO|nr:hypothetical protein EMPG_15988 [Blastomyces silverae]